MERHALPGTTLEREASTHVAPRYSEGSYFADPRRHSEDAGFKVQHFQRILERFLLRTGLHVRSLIDVGCGSGEILREISGFVGRDVSLTGYDVSPHVAGLSDSRIRFVHGDFCLSSDEADIVTMFDVVEHVPDPVTFIKAVAEHASILALHIPLDDSLNSSLRDRFKEKLQDPGHLIYLDQVSALNLLAEAGLTVIDYEFTFGFLAPSGHSTLKSTLAVGPRWLLARLSPWLLSKSLGGASLMVIAATPRGTRELQMTAGATDRR